MTIKDTNTKLQRTTEDTNIKVSDLQKNQRDSERREIKVY